MASFNIPGLGFATPNDVLPPMTSDSTPSQTAPITDSDKPAEATTTTIPSATLDNKEISEPEQDTPNQPETQHENPTISKESDVPMSEVHTEERPEQPAAPTETRPTSMDVDQHSSSNNTQPNGDRKDALLSNDQGNDSPSGLGNGAPVNSGDPMKVDEVPANGVSITDDLEAAIGGLGPFPDPVLEQQTNGEGQDQQEEASGEHPEWEIDSSPYESSSESDSSDSSSDEDSDNEQFRGLSIEETARLLMEAEAGSDDEDRGDKSSRAQVRTKNELPEEILPKPDVTITPEMKIEELGSIEHIVDTTIVIKAFTPGEYQVIDTGSALCTENRAVIGALADVLGKVQEPLYTVRFATPEDITEAGLQVGTKVFYSANHANYVFTQALKNLKGSDASNLHDEEVAEDEMEFSDDEKEAEYKRQLKKKRRERQGGGDSRGRGGQRAPHPLRNEVANDASSSGLNYDDGGDDDGPYKPLSRPPGYGSGGFSGEEPPPGAFRGRGGRGGFRGRGQSRSRGYGRGRGGSGPGSGGSREGYSLPSQRSYSHDQQPLPPRNNGGFNQRGSFNFQVPAAQSVVSGGQPTQGGGLSSGGYQAPAWPQAFPNPPFPNVQPGAWGGQHAPPPGLPQNNVPNPALLNPALLALISRMTAQNQQNQQQPSWQGPPDGQNGYGSGQ